MLNRPTCTSMRWGLKSTIAKLPCCSWARRHWQVVAHQSHMNGAKKGDRCGIAALVQPSLPNLPSFGPLSPLSPLLSSVLCSGTLPANACTSAIHRLGLDGGPLPGTRRCKEQYVEERRQAPWLPQWHLTKGAKNRRQHHYIPSVTQ